MSLGQLAGTPWQVGRFQRKAGDEKRHRSRCQFFEANMCLKLERRCHGSARCEFYQEKSTDFKEELPTLRQVLEKQFYRGRLVEHPKFGVGTIADLSQDRVSVAFRDGRKVPFDLEICLAKNIFSFPQ